MFRRRIILRSDINPAMTRVRATLEDDFHHFRVELSCVAGVVTQITGAAPRHPYTLCSGAIAQLDALLGMPLTDVAHAVTRVAPPTEQCTHLFELAGLAIATAARGTLQRQYDIEVTTPVDGELQSRLFRDGVLWLSWVVRNSVIQSPPPYVNIDLRQGMARWALSALPTEEAEAALVLRRCTVISKGRGVKLDEQIHARPQGHCFAQQPVRATQALRVMGSTWDFAQTVERLCADDQDWLAFKHP